MKFPLIIQIGNFAFNSHHLFELLAYGAGFRLYLFLRKRWPAGPKLDLIQTGWLLVGLIFGALLGAKTLAFAESWNEIQKAGFGWPMLLSGKTIVGAILGGWAGAQLVKSRLHLYHYSGDIYVFPLILGMIIGRLGCFFAGLPDGTYGIPTSLPWGVNFGDGPRHPAQLYEILFLLSIAAFFLHRIFTLKHHGCMFSQFVLAYLVYRFFSEFIKPHHVVLLYLTPIQYACAIGAYYCSKHINDACCGQLPKNSSSPCTQGEGRVGAMGPLPSNPSPSNTQNPHASLHLHRTTSLCNICHQKIDAKYLHLLQNNQIILQKFCPAHGQQQEPVADDPAFWKRSQKLFAKPPSTPLHFAASMNKGCPFDCGLCPDHEQHPCLVILEITTQCNMNCPLCFAHSSPAGAHLPLNTLLNMLDQLATRHPDLGVLQISGGEPTLHPDLFTLIDAARKLKFKHIMLNTNGVRIANDPEFAQKLSQYDKAFEVYLQFDSLSPDALKKLRGNNYVDVRMKAIENLNRFKIPTTLVVTLQKGVNDGEIGNILDFARKNPCVRGVTFQPIQTAGRATQISPRPPRMTLTAVRNAILSQSTLFTDPDIVPVPCHPDSIAMAYALRQNGNLIPLSKITDPQTLLDQGGNTICYEQDPNVRNTVRDMITGLNATAFNREALGLSCCLPLLPGKDSPIAYENIFRVVIMQFMDIYSLDLNSVRRSCVHIAQPDGKLIPFETHNLFHRKSAAGVPTGGERPTCNESLPSTKDLLNFHD